MFIDLLRKRRSIRQFEKRPVEQDKIDLLVEAMLRSPSSRSFNPWEFIVVTEEGLLSQLAQSKPHGASFLKNAPLAFVVAANPEKCDVWVEDCSIATLNLHYASTDIGLGSCWIQIRKREHDNENSAEDYVKKLLGIPEAMRVEAIVAVGYTSQNPQGHSTESLPSEQVSYELYGKGKS